VGSLSCGNNWSVGNEREVDTWVWDQVGLELVEIDVEGTIETEGSGDGRNNLGNQAVQVLVVWSFETKIASADIVDGFVVDHEGAVGVLKSGVGGKNRVVWLNDGGGRLWCWVYAELELALLAVIDGQTLHQQGTETRTGSTTEGVEDQETLETGAVIGDTAHLVENLVDQLLANSVVATSVVVRRILLAGDHLLWVEKAAVGAGADLIDDIWLEIAVNSTRNVLALAY
jgi:hypothetical protein